MRIFAATKRLRRSVYFCFDKVPTLLWLALTSRKVTEEINIFIYSLKNEELKLFAFVFPRGTRHNRGNNGSQCFMRRDRVMFVGRENLDLAPF